MFLSKTMNHLFVLFAALFSLSIASTVQAVSTGDQAPNFKVPRLEVKGELELKKYRGKVVYVDFWASWCGPCRQSLPILNKIRKDYRKKGFEVIAINLDEERSDAMDFLKQFPVSYPTARDTTGKIPESFGLQGMPTAYLIDRKGRISLVHEGFKKSDERELRKKIKNLLAKK